MAGGDTTVQGSASALKDILNVKPIGKQPRRACTDLGAHALNRDGWMWDCGWIPTLCRNCWGDPRRDLHERPAHRPDSLGGSPFPGAARADWPPPSTTHAPFSSFL